MIRFTFTGLCWTHTPSLSASRFLAANSSGVVGFVDTSLRPYLGHNIRNVFGSGTKDVSFTNFLVRVPLLRGLRPLERTWATGYNVGWRDLCSIVEQKFRADNFIILRNETSKLLLFHIYIYIYRVYIISSIVRSIDEAWNESNVKEDRKIVIYISLFSRAFSSSFF